MPKKKAKQVEASVEEIQPIEEETPEVGETPEVPTEEVPKTEEAGEAPEEAAEVGGTPVEEEIPEIPTEEVPKEAPKAERKVPVGSLLITAKFDYNGQLYQKRDSTAAVVSGLNLKETQRAQQMVWKAFPPDTLVIPK